MKIMPNYIYPLIGSIFLILITLLFLDVPPIFDGMWYYRCIDYSYEYFSFRDINCFDHPSFFYSLLLLFGKTLPLDFINYFHILHCLIGILGIWAFFYLLQQFFDDQKYNVEIGLFTLLFSIHPLIISNLLNINLDFIFMVEIICFLLFFIKGKIILSCLFALLMIFSREFGIIFLSIFYTGFLLLLLSGNISKKSSFFYSYKIISCLLISSILLFLSYKFYLNIVEQTDIWGIKAKTDKKMYDDFFPINFLDPYFKIRFSQIFILNFSYLISLPIFLYLYQRFILNKSSTAKISHPILIFIISCMFISLALIMLPLKGNVFSVVHTNTRYLLFLIPLFLIISLYSFINILHSKILLRRFIIILTIFLFLISNFRSLDPISFQVFGKHNFGNKNMYCMTGPKSASTEIVYCGRDEMIYNLEYINIFRLLEKTFQKVNFNSDYAISTNVISFFGVQKDWKFEPKQYTVFLNSNLLPDYYSPEQNFFSLDNKEYNDINLLPTGVYYTNGITDQLLNFTYLVHDESAKKIFQDNLTKKLYHIYIPYITGNIEEEKKDIEQYYNLISENIIKHNGYELILLEYTLKKL